METIQIDLIPLTSTKICLYCMHYYIARWIKREKNKIKNKLVQVNGSIYHWDISNRENKSLMKQKWKKETEKYSILTKQYHSKCYAFICLVTINQAPFRSRITTKYIKYKKKKIEKNPTQPNTHISTNVQILYTQTQRDRDTSSNNLFKLKWNENISRIESFPSTYCYRWLNNQLHFSYVA